MSNTSAEANTTLITMKRGIKNKIAMYQTVQAILQQNQSSWGSTPAFATLVGEFSGKLQELEDLSFQHGSVRLGVTAAKNALRKQTTEQARVFFGALKAHALFVKDVELAERANITQSALNNLGNLAFKHKLDEIIQLVTVRLNELGEYGIDQTKLDEFQGLRDACEAAFLLPRQAMVDRKTLTESIRQRVKSIDLLLKRGIDGLMMAYKTAAPDFYFHYKASRSIVDSRGRGKQGSDPRSVEGTDGD